MEVANFLAYYDMAIIATIKCFIVQAPGVIAEKGFTALIKSTSL
jgi:hypothetical protein